MSVRFPRVSYNTAPEGIRDLATIIKSLMGDGGASTGGGWPARYNLLEVQLFDALGTTIDDNLPDVEVFRDAIKLRAFDPAVIEQLSFSVALPHTYSAGTAIIPTVRWSPGNSTNTGTSRWGLEYSVAAVDTAFAASTTVYVEDAGSGTAYQSQSANGAEITMTGADGGTVIAGRLFRDATHVNDTFTGDAYLLSFGFQVLHDSNRGTEQPI